MNFTSQPWPRQGAAIQVAPHPPTANPPHAMPTAHRAALIRLGIIRRRRPAETPGTSTTTHADDLNIFAAVADIQRNPRYQRKVDTVSDQRPRSTPTS
jgi:hypothetical protein